MYLTPTELERLTLFSAAELARRHRERRLKLSHPEAIAYICDELLMAAREGRTLADLMGWGASLLTTDDVMPGVAELMPMIQVEGMFPDGAKMITVHDPIRPGKEKQPDSDESRPGEVITADGEIEINVGQRKATVTVLNTGDRAVHVASHFHFFEANKELEFDRANRLRHAPRYPVRRHDAFRPGSKPRGGSDRHCRQRRGHRPQQPD